MFSRVFGRILSHYAVISIQSVESTDLKLG